MTHEDVAREFMTRFCGGNVGSLEALRTEDGKFTGPVHMWTNRESYLECLRQEPPEKTGEQIIEMTTGSECVCMCYAYQKASGPLTVAQLFRFQDEKISEICLVFDSGVVSS